MERTISSHLHSLLFEIAAKHHFCLPEGGVRYLVEHDRELLVDALLQELSETGFGSDDEPNQRGFKIEEIIDFVASIDTPPDVSSG